METWVLLLLLLLLLRLLLLRSRRRRSPFELTAATTTRKKKENRGKSFQGVWKQNSLFELFEQKKRKNQKELSPFHSTLLTQNTTTTTTTTIKHLPRAIRSIFFSILPSANLLPEKRQNGDKMRKTEKLCSFSFSLFSRERFIAWDKRRLFFHTCFYPPSHTPTSRHGLPFPFFPSKKPHHLCSFRPASISRPKKKQEKQKKGGPTAAATRTSFSSPFPSPPPHPTPPCPPPHTQAPFLLGFTTPP